MGESIQQAVSLMFPSFIALDLQQHHPFTCLTSGQTQCGKTVFITTLLEHAEELIKGLPEVIMWSYGENQPLYTYIYDLISETTNDRKISHIFTKGSYHKNFSVILVSQNLFNKDRGSRKISLKSTLLYYLKISKMQLRFRI